MSQAARTRSVQFFEIKFWIINIKIYLKNLHLKKWEEIILFKKKLSLILINLKIIFWRN